MALHLLILCLLPAVLAVAPSGPWDQFNFAPKSKTVYATEVYRTEGAVRGAQNLVSGNESATLTGKDSSLTLDFGAEVGGLISLNIDAVNSSSSMALAFTESPMFIRPLFSDDSTYPSENTTYDGALYIQAPLSTGFWTQPAYSLRGGYRYLTITSTSDQSITISNVSCAISFMPHVDDLRAYSGYFYASDPVSSDPNLLNKIWYAGAYTVQTNTVALHTGRQVPFESAGNWANNATLGVAGPIIVDGAKRDRAVWPGDMGIAVPTQFVSTYDLLPTRNALSTMFAAINPITGALPESGPPLSQTGSDTYHAWTLIGTHNYFLYSGDTEWLETVWLNYTRAVAFLEGKVDISGLMNVTGLRDWARLGQGGHNSEGNALLYKVLTTAADLASYVNATSLASAWAVNATNLKAKFNEAFWVESAGLYRDNETTTLSPQDGNSFAVLYNLTTSKTQASRISAGLQKNWNDLGPVAPELPDTITPFISGFELQAHFESGNDDRALDLLRREWGYILNTNLSVHSTLLEGFTSNGSVGYRSYDGYNYDPSYTSHAHGWSSGPTSALTFYILGLTITTPKGQTWSVAPHLSGLNAAEGGFETSLGWFGVKWATNRQTFELNITAPTGTTGNVKLPVTGTVRLNGKKINAFGGEVSLDGGNQSLSVTQN